MTSNYPKTFDTERNLHTVRDMLAVSLQRDYNPGNLAITVDGDISLFPPTGIITLTDQVSSPAERSIALRYGKKSHDSFFDIEVMPDSKDVFKPKKLTNVTMQLRAEHHNSIVEATMAIQNFLGLRKNVDKAPLGHTLMGRVNFLINTIYTPKAWFQANNTVGLAPFTVEFTSHSQGINGPVGHVTYEWDFGDNSIDSTEETKITHTYKAPGIYDVTLIVTNSFGTDKVQLHELIKVKIDAPQEATINFVPQMGQIFTPGVIKNEQYTQPPVIRTPVGQLVSLSIPTGENPNNVGVSFAGEQLNATTKKPIDAITNYTWVLSDDLPHANSPDAVAAYTQGGMHDLTLRVDTQFGAYRITNLVNCIDSVETKNLWLWTLQGNITRAFEFGVINETFKTRKTVPLTVNRDSSFLDNVPNSKKQKYEFNRNNGMAQTSDLPSGLQGSCLLFWASGRNKNTPAALEEIRFSDYNAFTDTYTMTMNPIDRPWNWAALVSESSICFILGNESRLPPLAMSPTNTTKTEVSVGSGTIQEYGFNGYNFINGAQEVQFNSGEFDEKGQSVQGHFSSYRTTWRGNVGYILRSVWQDDHFTLKNFYKTDGVVMNPFTGLTKLLDVPNGGLREGQLAPLSSGVYLFSNMGAALCYKEETGSWEVAGGGNSGMFRMLQDRSVVGYDNEENTLLVSSDGDRKAFLSFDYSNKAFVKFNEADFTYTTLGARPNGEQWLMGIY